ncbi:MAG: hypothetical protein AUH29_02220 [Candidatus Rokubacteria bacterium 13_1_40CM_69_27]|nr:MAG: hypothetical protein AUH29_02220 [Candidatus Rokubacteria bacterium 13_1_40CM_69_27]OLC30121.1 MAG: hypothetical protein AUH81_20950 [Candidatus Rokubacteria bacterium 13_1_40CM_4_69_5]OLE36543.1 MAG: hypothetical protein AUG00_10410 [Candidatus Rokubacteria bacterium 13_1_20CM_2_70_7]
MRFAAPIVALTLLAGCAPAFDVAGREWTKREVSIQQVTLDVTECARQAWAAGWTPDLLLGGVLDLERLAIERGTQASTYRRCMRNRGYERTEAFAPAGLSAARARRS